MTPKQKKVLDFITETVRETGLSPSYREIQDHIGAASVSAPVCIVAALVRDGFLRKDGTRTRNLKPVTKQTELLKQLVRDCQSDLAKYLPPDGASQKDTISTLLGRLDGPQAREAMGIEGV